MEEQPSSKYGEIVYRFSNSILSKNKIKKIQVDVTAVKESTYVLTVNKEDEQIQMLHEYISESSQMDAGQVDQYYTKIVELV